jgi:hypothetical protein
MNCPAGPVELRENYGFASREISKIEAELSLRLQVICRACEEIHGID